MRYVRIKSDDPHDYSAEEYRGEVVISYGKMSYFKLKSVPLALLRFAEALKPDNMRWVEAKAGETVRPHRDHGITVSMNVYVQTCGSVTTFWEQKEGAQPFYFPGQKIANMYHADSLTKTGEFIARDGDIYLLDVQSLHSVDSTHDKDRIFVQLHWKAKAFDDVRALCVSHGFCKEGA